MSDQKAMEKDLIQTRKIRLQCLRRRVEDGKDMLEVAERHEEGAEVQLRKIGILGWTDDDFPGWIQGYEYRVKPKQW